MAEEQNIAAQEHPASDDPEQARTSFQRLTELDFDAA